MCEDAFGALKNLLEYNRLAFRELYKIFRNSRKYDRGA